MVATQFEVRLVMIAINHGAIELAWTQTKQVDTINSKWSNGSDCGGGAAPTSRIGDGDLGTLETRQVFHLKKHFFIDNRLTVYNIFPSSCPMCVWEGPVRHQQ